MSKVHKEKVTLESGSAYVVANEVFWEHVISVYESQSENSQDEWQQMADHIREWVNATIFYADEEDWD